MSEQIPPLELAFRVAELGGWDNVELLTHYSVHDMKVLWLISTGPIQERMYTNCEGDQFRVYDVRRRAGSDHDES